MERLHRAVRSVEPLVLVLDTSMLSAELVADYLTRTGAIRVVGTVDTPNDAVALLLQHRPTVFLVDRVPSPIEDEALLSALHAVDPALILHCTIGPSQSVTELESVGIRETVLKEVRSLDQLVAAVHRAANRNDGNGPSYGK